MGLCDIIFYMHTLGIDIGGTKIYGALYDEDWNIIQEHQIPTQAEKGAVVVFTNIVQLISRFDPDKIHSFGIAWPGFVNKEGQIQKTPNIPGFEGRYIAKELQELLGVSCCICNDAKLFALAESTQNDRATATLGVICGTGVGGGFVLDRKLIQGSHGYAGEIGHILINEQKANNLFSGQGIMAFMQQQEWGSDVKKVQQDMLKNKAPYEEAIAPLLEDMGLFLRNLILTYDLDDIVFGGSVGIHFWSLWFPEIQARIDGSLKDYPNTCQIRVSELKNAGALGAAMFAKHSFNVK